MDTIVTRQVVSRIAKEVASGLTQGQVDYYFQYKWKTLHELKFIDLVTQLKNLEREVRRLGEKEWAATLERHDPLREGELAFAYKVKMDWEW